MSHNPGRAQIHNIGMVSTRFRGTDGVSLETDKWVEVLEDRMGYKCYYFAGNTDKPPDLTMVVPEADFKHPDIEALHDTVFSRSTRPPSITQKINEYKNHIKEQIYTFVKRFDIHVLIVENALAIPMNIPLGLALSEFIAETGFRTIGHHHDLFWERRRFLVNCVWDYLNMAFPPHNPFIRHVVINSSAANQLSLRTGISSTLIPNIMNFENPPQDPDEYTWELREDLGLAPDELFFLQPTRVVQRKGIEHAIELTRLLGLKARLVISHAAGDEGLEYEKRVRHFAELLEVPVNFVENCISDERGVMDDGRKIYTLWDVYPYCDLVTYPSTVEGFGNAFLEAIYYRRPIVVNNYSIFSFDIKPKGFSVIEFDGYITQETLRQVRAVLQHPDLAHVMTDHNYQLGRRYYSYATLERHLRAILSEWTGD